MPITCFVAAAAAFLASCAAPPAAPPAVPTLRGSHPPAAQAAPRDSGDLIRLYHTDRPNVSRFYNKP